MNKTVHPKNPRSELFTRYTKEFANMTDIYLMSTLYQYVTLSTYRPLREIDERSFDLRVESLSLAQQ